MEAHKYGRTVITTHSDTKYPILFKMRDVGKALKYTAGGANFTRLIGIKKSPWNRAMKAKKHYVSLPANPEKKTGQRSNWLTPEGLALAIGLSCQFHAKHKEVVKFANWILSDHPRGEEQPLYGCIKNLLADSEVPQSPPRPKAKAKKPAKKTTKTSKVAAGKPKKVVNPKVRKAKAKPATKKAKAEAAESVKTTAEVLAKSNGTPTEGAPQLTLFDASSLS